MKPVNLKGLTLSELQEFTISLGEKKYRAAQLYRWIYGKQAQSFDEMSDISREFREVLRRSAFIENIDLAATSTSQLDGTSKFLFRLADGLTVESVLIPPEPASPGAGKRLTLCASTQVGCPLDCKFCATGTMGFVRNLNAGEIVDQLIQTQRLSRQRISNLVFMGMGEPMLNYDNVMAAADLINDDRTLNIGARRVTVSTAGHADKIRQMADEHRRLKLALSLHSLDDQKRRLLMPLTMKYPVADLVEALSYYYGRTRLRPTLEYILFDGFNDSPADAKKLAKLTGRVPCKVNIIPFHSIAFAHPTGLGSTLRPTPADRRERFIQELRAAHVTVMVRSNAGEDIQAACGQLAIVSRQNSTTWHETHARPSPPIPGATPL